MIDAVGSSASKLPPGGQPAHGQSSAASFLEASSRQLLDSICVIALRGAIPHPGPQCRAAEIGRSLAGRCGVRQLARDPPLGAGLGAGGAGAKQPLARGNSLVAELLESG